MDVLRRFFSARCRSFIRLRFPVSGVRRFSMQPWFSCSECFELDLRSDRERFELSSPDSAAKSVQSVYAAHQECCGQRGSLHVVNALHKRGFLLYGFGIDNWLSLPCIREARRRRMSNNCLVNVAYREKECILWIIMRFLEHRMIAVFHSFEKTLFLDQPTPEQLKPLNTERPSSKTRVKHHPRTGIP